MIPMRRLGIIMGACFAFYAAAPVAAEPSATFQVTAEIVPGCEINGLAPASGQNIGGLGTLDFGEHSGLATGAVSTSLVQNTSLTLRCTPSVALTMTLSEGLHVGSGRNLQGPGGDRVAYSLYQDAAFSEELVANQAFQIDFADQAPISLPIYGRLMLDGTNVSGTYSDTVMVSLEW